MSSQFIQLIVDGLASGSIYAALALAIVLVYRATGLVNFAQGVMAVFSTYIAFTLWRAGLWPIAAILLAVGVSLVFGAGVERVVIRRFERGSVATAIVVTVGLFVLIQGISGAIWSYNPLTFPSLFPLSTVKIAGAVIGVRSLGTIAVLVVVVVLLQLLFQKTKLGLALRAVADNPESGSLLGLHVGRLLMIGWALAAALGAIAGCLVAPQVFLTPSMLDFVLVYALAAIITGGLDSPVGAVIAAWLIGILENLASAYLPVIGDDLKIIVPLLAMFIVLTVRPQGLFGRKELVRV
ncbi:branched-chain amino acid ABC transporter permease [Microbacterium kribbense]|uniref:Branched-chain amino acid ABC transporter permease n=1 Tax=Microbacterium kribbense TaxID=433645 RepID=A0ABP7GTW6_9MICO